MSSTRQIDRFFVPTILFAVMSNTSAAELEEVVVTAQRREQNLQTVSLPVSAFSADALERGGIDDISRLELVTPGLVFGQAGSDARPSMRGIDTHSQEAIAEPTTAFFVDGVYKSRTSQALAAFVDVERVEVQRGPSGTLFGRNTTAGFVHVITKKPTDQLEWGGDLTYGRFNEMKGSGYLNVPINDELAVRLAFDRHKRDGFVENIGPGPDLYDINQSYVRASVSWEPMETVSLLVQASYFSSDTASAGIFGYRIDGTLVDPDTGLRSVNGVPVAVNTRLGGDGQADINGFDVGIPIIDDEYTMAMDFENSAFVDEAFVSATFEWDFGPATLKSISSYTYFNIFREEDVDFLPINDRWEDEGHDVDTFTQEVQIVSNPRPDSPLEWTIGAFYLKDTVEEDFFFLSGLSVDAPFLWPRDTRVEVESIAAYGQASYFVTDRARITFGGRYTQDEKSIRQTQDFLGIAGGSTFSFLGREAVRDTSATFDAFTWTAGLDFFLKPDVMAYFNASKGFRSGGFNNLPFDFNLALQEASQAIVGPETIQNFAFGMKGDFFDGTLRLNVEAFFADVEDRVISTVTPVPGLNTGTGTFDSAGGVEIRGVEAEISGVFLENGFFSGSIAYLDAEYSQFDERANPFQQAGLNGEPLTLDLAGNSLNLAPEWKLSIGAGYDVGLGEWGTLTPYVQFVFVDEYFTTEFNTPLDRQDSYTKTDLRLIWRSADERWHAEAFVENLENEAVLNNSVFAGGNALFANYAPPRMFGVKVGFDFK